MLTPFAGGHLLLLHETYVFSGPTSNFFWYFILCGSSLGQLHVTGKAIGAVSGCVIKYHKRNVDAM